MAIDPNWTVGQAQLQVARVACEQLGSAAFDRMRSEVDRLIRANGGGLSREALIRPITLVLMKATDAGAGPKGRQDAQIAGVCLLWLGDTPVREERLLHLYGRMLPHYRAAMKGPASRGVWTSLWYRPVRAQQEAGRKSLGAPEVRCQRN
jgi:hypothetical protein